MRLTVLGSSASYAGAGQACAGHLIEGEGARLLLDCGNGVLANLQRVTDPLTVDAVFVSHYHPDHYVDLFALHALLRYAPQGPVARMPVYMPEGLFARMECMLSERGAADFEQAFELHVLTAGVPLTFGGLKVTPHQVVHTVPTFALAVQEGARRFVYTSDCSLTDEVRSAVTGADFVLAEATLPEEYAGVAPHLTASEAGALAAGAGASSLVMAHVWPTNDRELMAELASSAFGRPALVATEFDTFDI